MNYYINSVMTIKKYFEYSPSIDLTAAHICLNKWNWKYVNEQTTNVNDEGKSLMKNNRYDILPVKNSDNSFASFFTTVEWNNYQTIEKRSIEKSDTIYYRISFIDLIRKFKKEKRNYYFLSNHQEILGLVSVVNLNSQSVYSYLFQLIADLELRISALLKTSLNQDEVINALKTSSDVMQNNIANSYEKSLQSGTDNTIYEHMNLQTLGILLKKFRNSLNDDFLLSFQKNFVSNGVYNNIRNTVMHPVRPIINEKVNINNLNKFLTDYEIITTHLNSNL